MATAAYACMTCACTDSYNRHADKMMARAESLMDEHPDSAMTLLDSIDSKLLRGERRRALHGLLSTQARDKNYIDQTSDSIMAPVTEYFDRTGDRYHRMLAHYYMAKIYYYRKEYPASTQEVETAMECLSQDMPDESFWRARMYNDIAEMSYMTSNHAYSIAIRKKAIHMFDSLKLYAWKTDAYLSLIKSYQAYQNWDKTDYMIDSVRDKCTTKYHDMNYKLVLIHSLTHKKEWEKAADLYVLLCDSTDEYDIDSYDYAYISYLKTQLGDSVSARKWLEKAYSITKNREDTLNILHFLFMNHLAVNPDKALHELFEKYYRLGNRESQFRISNHVAVGSNEYHRDKAEMEHMHAELSKNRLIIAIICLILTVLTAMLVFSRFRQRKTSELNELAVLNNTLRNDISVLNDNLLANSRMTQEATASLCATLTIGIDRINKISKKKLAADREFEIRNCATQACRKTIPLSQTEKSFLNEFSKMISSLNSPLVYGILEKTLNATEDGIMHDFRNDFKSLPEKDLQFATLIFSKMSSHTICIVLDIPNLETFRTRKSRLKKVIEQSHAQKRDIYLQKFSKQADTGS